MNPSEARDEPLNGTMKRWKKFYMQGSGGVKKVCSEADLSRELFVLVSLCVKISSRNKWVRCLME